MKLWPSQHVSVYACVRVIAESVGSLTIRTYKKMPKGRQEAIDDPSTES